MENKQKICDHIADTLKETRNAGSGNALERLIYEKTASGDEYVIPVFAESGEWGRICVTGDSGTAMICDIVKQFVAKMW